MDVSLRDPEQGLAHGHATGQGNGPARTKKALAMVVLFVTLSVMRAIHPIVITASKLALPDGRMGFAYQKSTPACIYPVVIFCFFQLVQFGLYGMKGWRDIWRRTPMIVFGINGAILAVDDILEMQTLSTMSGAPYQVLCQSKILVTALLLMPFKGLYQTRMQWMLLTTLMCAMSVYMCIAKSGNNSSKGGDIPILGYLFVLLKVTVSCLGAVYADKYTKEHAKSVSLPAVLVQLSLARIIVMFSFVTCTSSVWSDGFFAGWDALTVAVVVSFCFKSALSYAVLAILDAIMKNIAECVAVLLIFFYDVFAPWVDFVWDMPTFLAVLVVLLTIAVYLDSKTLVEKVKKMEALGPK